MEFLNYLIVSYNLWFIVPLAVAVLLALFRLAKWVSDSRDTVDTDKDADVDVDPDANGGMDTVTDTTSPATVNNLFGFLSLGRVPPRVVLLLLCVTWGVSGLLANVLLGIPENPARAWLSCGIAGFSCVFGTRYISSLISNRFPVDEKSISGPQLLGLSGRVISGQITTTFGTSRVQVPNGPELTVSCRARPDEATPLKGDTIVLVNYDHAKRIFEVKKTE